MKTSNFFIGSLLFVIALISCNKSKVNKLPVAYAGPDQTVQLPKNFTTLNGIGKDENGTITCYLWSKISGPNLTAIENAGEDTTKVTGLIAGNYLFKLKVMDNEGGIGLDTVSINVLPAVIKTLTLQPGAAEGQDSRPFATQGCQIGSSYDKVGDMAFTDLEDMSISAWTLTSNNCSTGQYRSFIKFTGLSAIAQSAIISSAKLSLYGVTSSLASPQGNSYYPGSIYNSSGTNECWIKRVTGSWSEATLTWNNQPTVTDVNRIAIAASTSQWNYNVIDIDVTDMIKTMVNNANSNNGFCIMLQTEQFYRCVNFGSSDNVDPAKRPKLVVVYNE